MNFSLTKKEVEVYQIRQKDTSTGWADITLDEGERSGRISIASDYGNWSYYWGACGESFKKFLCNINLDYVASKFGEANYFDHEETLNSYKRDVLIDRREDYISAKEARELWDEIESLNDNIHLESFKVEIWRKEKLMDFFDSSPVIEVKTHPRFERFWNSTWKYFTEKLKKEL